MVHVKIPSNRGQNVFKPRVDETLFAPPVVLQHQRNLRIFVSRNVRVLIVLIRIRIRAKTRNPDDMFQVLPNLFCFLAKLRELHVFRDVLILRGREEMRHVFHRFPPRLLIR
jgi:hypothetical protein